MLQFGVNIFEILMFLSLVNVVRQSSPSDTPEKTGGAVKKRTPDLESVGQPADISGPKIISPRLLQNRGDRRNMKRFIKNSI